MNKKPKIKSTYDQFIDALTPEQKKEYEEGYKDLLLSELLIAAMEQDDISVRELAKMAGISPTIVQGIRSGSRKNFSVQSLLRILNGLGCKLVIERNGNFFPVELSSSNKNK